MSVDILSAKEKQSWSVRERERRKKNIISLIFLVTGRLGKGSESKG